MLYIDNAATTFPKPARVLREANRCAAEYCGNPGRSSHRLSAEAARAIYECREEVASLFGGRPENVVFTLNATYALNIAIKSFVHPGDHILISGIEHNAVLRPVAGLSGCGFEVFNALGGDDAVIRDIRSKIRGNTALIVCNHASNICGITMPAEKIGRLCAEKGIKFIIDASQSAGIRKLDLNTLKADVICAPGHKGLYGLQGTGFALFADKYLDKADRLLTFAEGGGGVNSLETFMPDFLPERFEAGTLPTPSIVGLKYGIREIKKIGVGEIYAHETALAGRLIDALLAERGVTVYAPEYKSGGTVLFNIDNLLPNSVSEKLDKFGICVRSGLHCSPLAHKLLGTGHDGAIRASFSIFNSNSDVNELVRRVREIKRMG